MVRVLHVVRSLEVGGLERLVADLVRARQGAATSVLCLTCLGPIGEQLRNEGIEVKALGIARLSLAGVLRSAAAVRRAAPQVLHCHNMQAHLHGGLAARMNGDLPVVLTKHGMVTPTSGLIPRLNRRLARRTEIVAVSEDVRGAMRRWLGFPKQVHRIGNGIPLASFEGSGKHRLSVRARQKWSAETFVFGCVARLAPSKDHETLLNAFAKASSSEKRLRLVLVGDGPLRAELERAVAQLNLSGNVEMLGERDDVYDLLPAFDAFVLASRNEGLPMTLLEAMAARLPVVATSVGGIPEVVLPDETGILVEPESPDELAHAMLTLFQQPDLRRRIREGGRRRVDAEFDLRIAAERYEVIYRRLASGKWMTDKADGPME